MDILIEIANERDGHLPPAKRIEYALLKGILSGEIPNGHKLTESALSKEFRTSRTPVREALTRLEYRGVIRQIANRGAFAQNLNHRDIEDLFQLRIDGEKQAVKWAIERMTEEDEDALAEIYTHMKFYTAQNDIPKMLNINTAFHRLIYRATHNHILSDNLTSWEMIINFRVPSNYFEPGYLKNVFKEHRHIYEGIMTKDFEKAKKATEEHIHNTKLRKLRNRNGFL